MIEKSMPWVENYRPKCVDDLMLEENTIEIIKKSLNSNNMPHLLFYGPPGTGKTSTALTIANQLYGPKYSMNKVMELNASDERGIHIVREKIKNFASNVVSTCFNDNINVSYKLCILDEADNMTPDAQNALRRTIESYSRVTRFLLICNYVTRIIEPISSRCAKFFFKPLSESNINKRLDKICISEKINLQSDSRKELIKVSNGDFRKAITVLQTATSLDGDNIKSQTIYEIAGKVPHTTIKNIWKILLHGNFDEVNKSINYVIAEAFQAQQILLQLFDMVLNDKNIQDIVKSKISIQLGLADKALVDGSDEYLQLLNTSQIIYDILRKISSNNNDINV